MDVEEFRNYCLSKNGVTEEFPFDKDTLVFKVGGKIFALCGLENYSFVNLKCDPERAILLREEYSGIIPGYHMSKKHWNSVATDGSIPPQLFRDLVDHSYELIVHSLPKKIKATL